MGFLKSQMWKVLEWKDDSQDTIVYRFDMKGQEIMSGSQLTVRESQVAVFVHLGQIADVFLPGKYKLTTKNLPILSGIGSIWYQGESRFKAELYFVNTKQFTECKWGTVNPVTMRDDEFGMIRIKAHGIYDFRVTDAEKFLKEIFGTNGLYKVSDIEGKLKGMLVSQMSDTIAESKISALDMAANLTEFGAMVQKNMHDKLENIGLDVTNFTIMSISFPEAVEKAIDERTTLGIVKPVMGTYTQKKAADALGDAAKNPGMAGAFIGMGVGANAGGAINGVFGNIANAHDEQPQNNAKASKKCPNCGANIAAGAKFCAECGAKQEQAAFCPECGAKVSPNAKFCVECGAKLK